MEYFYVAGNGQGSEDADCDVDGYGDGDGDCYGYVILCCSVDGYGDGDFHGFFDGNGRGYGDTTPGIISRS